MQRSALFTILFTIFALFSVALASPLPVQAIQEAREPVVELSVREVPIDHELLHREVIADTDSGANLHILAREHKSFDDYVQEMADGKNTPKDNQDIEPRICRWKMCQ